MSSVLEISPLTRVEGHGRVSVYLDGKRVERVRLALTESPRLFEALLVGKSYQEVPEIICRICSLCSTVHRIASLLAIEKALVVEVSEQVRLYRELILNGGHIQSHALHLFCLVLPDYVGSTGIADLAVKASEELNMGLRIKAAGNLIQEIVGGRLIHPVTLIPGGMGKPVTRKGLLQLKETLTSVIPDSLKAYELFRSFPLPLESLGVPRFMAVQSNSAPPLFGERLMIDSEGSVPVECYRETLGEKVVAYSNSKTSVVEGEPLIVGALARLNLGVGLSPKGARAFRECRAQLVGRDIRANNLAQTMELAHALERSMEIADILLDRGFDRERPTATSPHEGEGSAVIEAPRGVLIHSYSFDGRGLCRAADIITPTAINQAAMERDLLLVARSMEGSDESDMTLALEQLIRAYDPCISCAVHL
ncbi:MAG TPA: Ni/Fe hydrogenase subunit alpha, partial [Geobacteraceae bacterium]|nr:Ni/Fe hydrogenase subunit alpha [Geobacteraceae bacterium]